MKDLIKQLDTLLKPVNDAMKGIPAATLVRYVAIYALIDGIINFCASIGLLTAGIFGGAAAIMSGATIGGSTDGQQATAALGAASGLAVVSGVLYLIAAPILLIVAFGLYRRMGWARMGAVVAFALSAVVALLHLFGGDILSIIWVLASLYLAYFFYSDPGIKREFGQV